MVCAKLVVVGGDFDVAEIKLSQLPATIGRGRENTISLPHPLVSRVHCRIVEHDKKLMVQDNESLNGTFIGNQRIEEGVLHHEDLLTIGSVTFRAVYLDSNGSPTCETTRMHDVNETVRIDRVATECQAAAENAAKSVQSAEVSTN
jgi:pSer/pThr/pTyr-binding forkhead associated (FHA) protein